MTLICAASRSRAKALRSKSGRGDAAPTRSRIINELRSYLAQITKGERNYLPHRTGNEHLQVITVVNFKGGSGKTTTAAHLAQYLALRGYRVLALDLDPQASLSALHGLSAGIRRRRKRNALRRDPLRRQRRDLNDIIRPTYFANLDLVPGNLELMEFEHETPKALLAGDATIGSCSSRGWTQRLRLSPTATTSSSSIARRSSAFSPCRRCASATAVLVTVHPQMLDVMSMCQFLIMTSRPARRRRQGRRQHELRLDALSGHPLRAG